MPGPPSTRALYELGCVLNDTVQSSSQIAAERGAMETRICFSPKRHLGISPQQLGAARVESRVGHRLGLTGVTGVDENDDAIVVAAAFERVRHAAVAGVPTGQSTR